MRARRTFRVERRPTTRPALGRALGDPLAAVATYAVLMVANGRSFTASEVTLAVIAFGLAYPGRIPFRRLTPGFVAEIFGGWALIAFALLPATLVMRAFGSIHTNTLLQWLIATPFVMTAVHILTARFAGTLTQFQGPRPRAVIVGATEASRRIADAMAREHGPGQQIVAYFDDRRAERLPDLRGVPLEGRIDDVAAFVNDRRIDLVYTALPLTAQPRVMRLLDALRDTTASIRFVPDVFAVDLIHARVDAVAGVPVLAICETPFHGTSAAAKRAFDVVCVTLALPLVLPVMAVVALAIRLTSPGPAIFRQRRYGLGGEEIVVWKFRSMRVQEDGASTYRQVVRGDDRVTPIGRLIRKTSIDELPQLFNVLGGSMSLVGPRPHAVAVNEQYRRMIPGYMMRHKVKPGITGWAQVNGYRGGDDIDSMRKRIEYDLEYLRGWTVWFDLRILAMTVLMVVRGDPKAF